MSSRHLALQRIVIKKKTTYDVTKLTEAYHELVNVSNVLLSKQLMLVVNPSRIYIYAIYILSVCVYI